VKLRGVNRHDEHPDTGRATTREQWLQDIQGMKAANINYIRAAHYPPAEGFLDLCDELGMYVSDEVPMGEGGNHLEDPGFTGATMLRSYETVARDINHPAVVIWSIGNEDPLTSLHMAAIHTVKALDPTRPVLMPWRPRTGCRPKSTSSLRII
jgi:beta-galactosidase